MSDPTHYVQFGFFLITAANLAIVGLLILVFLLAVVLRPPGEQQASTLEPLEDGASATGLQEQL